ncbi:hypothetical protein HERIO_174 [Hepatospora eriocheir]|uniref:Uncharacterized protein n=1 Tax=Hepatospora eriocheir TaxID=1081669 RepID=A0A1X0QE96_9MICR|nr:hypothetical protein HERIO_174 [Hepatospora eriocheir]
MGLYKESKRNYITCVIVIILSVITVVSLTMFGYVIFYRVQLTNELHFLLKEITRVIGEQLSGFINCEINFDYFFKIIKEKEENKQKGEKELVFNTLYSMFMAWIEDKKDKNMIESLEKSFNDVFHKIEDKIQILCLKKVMKDFKKEYMVLFSIFHNLENYDNENINGAIKQLKEKHKQKSNETVVVNEYISLGQEEFSIIEELNVSLSFTNFILKHFLFFSFVLVVCPHYQWFYEELRKFSLNQ